MFVELAELMQGFNLKMSIQKQEGQLIVSLQPVQIGDTNESFPPLVLKGTAEEFDAEFLNKIKNAMVKTNGIMSNISFYAEQMKKKEDAVKEAAMKKSAPAKSAAGKKEEVSSNLFEAEE